MRILTSPFDHGALRTAHQFWYRCSSMPGLPNYPAPSRLVFPCLFPLSALTLSRQIPMDPLSWRTKERGLSVYGASSQYSYWVDFVQDTFTIIIIFSCLKQTEVTQNKMKPIKYTQSLIRMYQDRAVLFKYFFLGYFCLAQKPWLVSRVGVTQYFNTVAPRWAQRVVVDWLVMLPSWYPNDPSPGLRDEVESWYVLILKCLLDYLFTRSALFNFQPPRDF